MTDLREDLRRAAQRVAPPEDGFQRLLSRRIERRRNERVTAGLVALTVAVAGIGGAVLALRTTAPDERRPIVGRPGSSDDRSPRLEMQPREYLYVKTVIISETGQSEVETWWALDGSGRIESVAADPNYGVPPSDTFGAGEFPVWSDLSGLSADPQELARQLRDRSAPGGASPQPAVTPGPGHAEESGGLWRAVDDLLFDMPNTTPDVRAALFEVTRGIAGVEQVDGAEDPVGRAAILLRFTSEGANRELYFDPTTLQPMATVEISVDDAWGPWYTIAVSAGLVGSTEGPPTAEQSFFPPPVTDFPEP
jgi:hypothetical protein